MGKTHHPRLREVLLYLSPSCVTREKTGEEKNGAFAVFFRVMHDVQSQGLNEEELSGARFSKALETFRARRAIVKSRIL